MIFIIACWVVICCFFAFRNEWVYAKRVAVLSRSVSEYNKLIGYNEMMKLFWVWDIEKLKRPRPC